MATCGHLPTQFSILETLLRWLLPRRDRAVRKEAAAKWFPEHLYRRMVVDIFLERTWMNFFQDARDLLNLHNESSNLIVSVICRKLTIGKRILLSSVTDRQQTWLDINSANRSVTVLLDPRVVASIGAPSHLACETLAITADNTLAVKLYRESVEVTLELTTVQPPQLVPSGLQLFGDICDVTVVISSRSDMLKVDRMLKSIFEEKYQMLMDLDKLTLSPECKGGRNPEEEKRFSRPATEFQRRKHSGYVVRSNHPASLKSPSTTSTSSLAQLQNQLAALPRYKFDKEPVSVCAQPKLSRLTELSESDDKLSLVSTITTFRLGADGHRSFRGYIEERKSQSDSEIKRKPKNTVIDDKDKYNFNSNVAIKGTCDTYTSNYVKDNGTSMSDTEHITKYTVSPAEIREEKSASCLLIATIGSADESVINDTLERITKNKEYATDNIVDLLVKEALYATNDSVLDSGINTSDGKKTEDSEAIENTPNFGFKSDPKTTEKEKCTVISKSTTTDESNTEAINDTPMTYVSVRKKNLQRKKTHQNRQSVDSIRDHISCDVQAVEEFFAQHFSENQAGEIVVSPTLAKKINETSSESSDFDNYIISNTDFNLNIEQYESPSIEIIECLNNMVDKVCNNIDKCTEYLNNDQNEQQIKDIGDIGEEIQDKSPFKEISNISSKNKSKRNIKLKYKSISKKQKIKNNKLKLEPTTTIPSMIQSEIDKEASPKVVNTRRKRKLYSPKSDVILDSALEDQGTEEKNLVVEDDIPLIEIKRRSNTASTAVSYKELEKERSKSRRLRARKSKSEMQSPLSARTKKLNDEFDKLKDTVESNVEITLADKKTFNNEYVVFNFTSDSEDEDFKQKKINIQKRSGTTTIGSGNSAVSSRRGRILSKIDYNEDNKVPQEVNKNRSKRKRTASRKSSRTNVCNIKQPIDLVDEKMRQAETTVLDTSLTYEKPIISNNTETDPMILIPDVELITDDDTTKDIKTEEKKKSKKTEKNPKKAKQTLVIEDKDDDRTVSPLPGLVVEMVPNKQDYGDDSLTSNMVQKFKKVIKEGTGVCVNDTNTTHNLLSDVEPGNFSMQINIINESNNTIEEDHFNIHEEQRYRRDDLNKTDFIEKNNSPHSKTINISLAVGSSKEKEQTHVSVKHQKIKQEKKEILRSKTKSVIESNEEIIVIDDNPQVNRPPSKAYDSSDNEAKSEKSIATAGITAHGDLSEVPPSPKSLEKILMPREIADMDESMVEYYFNLRKEIETDSRSSKLYPIQHLDNENERERISPVLSLKKKSTEDVSNWPKGEQQLFQEDISRWLPSARNSSDSESHKSEKSLCVSITRLSHKDIGNWLPHHSMSDHKSQKSTDERNKILSLPKTLNAKLVLDNTNSKRDSDVHSQNSDDSHNVTKMSTFARTRKARITDNTVKSNKSKMGTQRKSIISPIKIFDNTSPIQTRKSQSNRMVDEFAIQTQNTSKNNDSKSDTTPRKRENNRYPLRKFPSGSSPDSNISTSTRIEQSRKEKTPVKRSLCRNEDVECKRRKLPENEQKTCLVSRRSVSSVDDWFKRNEPASSEACNLNLSTNDALQNIMEKLVTTLPEIHENTSKKFINLFVEAQKHLGELKEQRYEMFKHTATNILTRVSSIIDEEFTELHRRSQEQEDKFMSILKQRGAEFLREDCKQKKAMVVLLQEDVQAVLDYVAKSGNV